MAGDLERITLILNVDESPSDAAVFLMWQALPRGDMRQYLFREAILKGMKATLKEHNNVLRKKGFNVVSLPNGKFRITQVISRGASFQPTDNPGVEVLNLEQVDLIHPAKAVGGKKIVHKNKNTNKKAATGGDSAGGTETGTSGSGSLAGPPAEVIRPAPTKLPTAAPPVKNMTLPAAMEIVDLSEDDAPPELEKPISTFKRLMF